MLLCVLTVQYCIHVPLQCIFEYESFLQTFRRLLLNKCQDEFENRSKATEGMPIVMNLYMSYTDKCKQMYITLFLILYTVKTSQTNK